jgi:hypothetical protein
MAHPLAPAARLQPQTPGRIRLKFLNLHKCVGGRGGVKRLWNRRGFTSFAKPCSRAAHATALSALPAFRAGESDTLC